ncbi:MAG: phosphoserine phosphatase RsbU/P [Acidimicrobiaceae bacterium]|nr:phosphoserine phosphatase RsbU/P [Acidimicrobiaceae bacterium]
MVSTVIVIVVALGCFAGTVVWSRSALRLGRACQRIEQDLAAVPMRGESPAAELARSDFRKELHTAILYGLLTVVILLTGLSENLSDRVAFDALRLLLLVPVVVSLINGRRFLDEARQAEERFLIERRAKEVATQEVSAPLAWAARLAPAELPPIEGFEVGRVYEPGSGAMAGDFYDLYHTAPSRLAAVIGDVAGHGIEPSITAFQVKYLLRVFLREYRDPAQALEELNLVLSASGRPEDLVSLCAVVFDSAAGSLRFASAGHPPAWIWHDGEVRPLRSTGPLLTLDPKGTYVSYEFPLNPGDVALLYTDGLSEARAGEQLFGEDRIAAMLRRDPGEDLTTLCKGLLEAARDFATAPLTDDIAILAIRRT